MADLCQGERKSANIEIAFDMMLEVYRMFWQKTRYLEGVVNGVRVTFGALSHIIPAGTRIWRSGVVKNRTE